MRMKRGSSCECSGSEKRRVWGSPKGDPGFLKPDTEFDAVALVFSLTPFETEHSIDII